MRPRHPVRHRYLRDGKLVGLRFQSVYDPVGSTIIGLPQVLFGLDDIKNSEQVGLA